jgi:hypothetical protein
MSSAGRRQRSPALETSAPLRLLHAPRQAEAQKAVTRSGLLAPPHLAAQYGHSQRKASQDSSQTSERRHQTSNGHHRLPTSECSVRALTAEASGKDRETDDQQRQPGDEASLYVGILVAIARPAPGADRSALGHRGVAEWTWRRSRRLSITHERSRSYLHPWVSSCLYVAGERPASTGSSRASGAVADSRGVDPACRAESTGRLDRPEQPSILLVHRRHAQIGFVRFSHPEAAGVVRQEGMEERVDR